MSQPVDFAFLHGGGQGSWVWDETIAALGSQSAGGFGRALALDVPGCGVKRGRDTSALGFEDIAGELIADIEAAGLRDVVLVGHSQAGSVMPHLLTARPDLFRRAVYVSCSVPFNGQSVVGMIGNGVHGEREDEVGWPVNPAETPMEQRFRTMFCNDMAAAEADAFMAKLGRDAWPMASYSHTEWRHEELGAVPASYVLCLRDGILPVSWQEIFAVRFRAERVIRIDAGHQAMTTRPQTLAEILLHETR
jgi:pimeloyl-ACP methyl ester carboxylesterase